jgi:hypothetical protein
MGGPGGALHRNTPTTALMQLWLNRTRPLGGRNEAGTERSASIHEIAWFAVGISAGERARRGTVASEEFTHT